jgi:hypothetical protein
MVVACDVNFHHPSIFTNVSVSRRNRQGQLIPFGITRKTALDENHDTGVFVLPVEGGIVVVYNSSDTEEICFERYQDDHATSIWFGTSTAHIHPTVGQYQDIMYDSVNDVLLLMAQTNDDLNLLSISVTDLDTPPVLVATFELPFKRRPITLQQFQHTSPDTLLFTTSDGTSRDTPTMIIELTRPWSSSTVQKYFPVIPPNTTIPPCERVCVMSPDGQTLLVTVRNDDKEHIRQVVLSDRSEEHKMPIVIPTLQRAVFTTPTIIVGTDAHHTLKQVDIKTGNDVTTGRQYHEIGTDQVIHDVLLGHDKNGSNVAIFAGLHLTHDKTHILVPGSHYDSTSTIVPL